MKKLLLIPMLLFWYTSVFASPPVKEPRFSQSDQYYLWEWRFCPGTADICFGHETCPLNWGEDAYVLNAMRFQCGTGGTASKIGILTPSGGSSSGTILMAVYSDYAADTRPETRLWLGTEQTYAAGTWVEEAVTGLTVTEGTYYWLCWRSTTSSTEVCYLDGQPYLWHRWQSGTTFPSSWGSAGGGNTNQYTIRLCVPGGVSDVYSGKFPRGIARGIVR